MTDRSGQHVIVVGAGLAGSLMACYLAEMGCNVSLFERRPDPRAKGFLGGRSINLALSTRGIRGLEGVGLDDVVLADAIPMRGRKLHSPTGELAFQPYSKNENEAINSISRSGLNLTLLRAAEQYEQVSMRFRCRCENVDFGATSATFVDEESGETFAASADAIIGTDGAFSAVRGAMEKTDRFDYSQSYLDYGYKELHIPPTADGGFALEPNALHIWPRGRAMMIALPNCDKTFTCTLFWPFEGDHSFAQVKGSQTIREFFEKHYPDAVPLMPTLVEDFESNPTSSLVTVKCFPWNRGNVLLIGDAAHAIVPFFGQGMNAAFEDCAILAETLRQHSDFGAAFGAFARGRKKDADAIADMALDNFVEMRDKVGSRVFRWKKKGEKLLHKLLPGWFRPLYNMVSFSTIPYSEARRIARRQGRIVVVASMGIVVLVLGLLLMVV